MDFFLLTKLSIPHLNNAALSILTAIYLFSSQRDSKSRKFLAMFFVLFSFYFISLFLVHSTLSVWAMRSARLSSMFIMLSLIPLMLFAYHIPVNIHPRESRLMVIAVSIVGLMALTDTLINLAGAEPFNPLRIWNNPLLPVLFIAWTIVLLLRKATLLAWDPQLIDPHPDNHDNGKRLPQPIAKSREIVEKLRYPRSRQARTLRAFAVAMILLIMIPFLPLVERFGFILSEVFLFLINLSGLLFLLGFTFYYFESGLERSSLAVKFIGFNIFMMMIILSGIGFLTIQAFERDYDENRQLELQLLADALLDEQDLNAIKNTVYMASQPLKSSKTDPPIRVLHSTASDMTQHGFTEAVLDSVVKKWFIPEIFREARQNPGLPARQIKQNVLQRIDRSILLDQHIAIFSEADIYEIKAQLQHTVYLTESEGQRLCAVFSYLAFRRYSHEYTLYFTILILLSAALILTVFTLFFRRRFIRPLTDLISGVNRVNAGHFDVRVPVQYENEIGYLTHSFNDMIASINKAGQQLQQYARELESKVEERTRQLADTNTALEEKNEALTRTLRELREAQSKLLMQEKMAMLGNLIAGITHEINTPVGVLNSFVSLASHATAKIRAIQSNPETPESVRNHPGLLKTLQILETNCQTASTAERRISQIVRSLKNFVQLDQSAFKHADIHEGLESTLALLDHELKARVQVVRHYGSIPRIYCSPQHLNQVFMNLILNAARAIETRGTLTITTASDGKQVFITIADSGRGIPREKLARVFEPGFTSDDSRIKLGSGLSTSYNIIQNHHGEIRLDSEPGKGTTVRITLPVAGP
ncbi:MAG: HAMP domain-containing protein [Calditrichae bacterium]|nr:HAMP domain-containing protein [Calditrichota bacterium]MCB9090063.1 HAMP domain-containing protein [Calditrichia bacterium]